MALRDLIASPGDVVAKRLSADYRIDADAHARIIQEVNAAVRAEREACAVAAATLDAEDAGPHETYGDGRRAAAAKIRARS